MSAQSGENVHIPYLGDPYGSRLYSSPEAEEMHVLRQEALRELADGVGQETPAIVINVDRLKAKIEEIRERRAEFRNK